MQELHTVESHVHVYNHFTAESKLNDSPVQCTLIMYIHVHEYICHVYTHLSCLYPAKKQFLYFALIFCSLVFAWFLQYTQSVCKCQLIYLIFILHCFFQASLQVLGESTSQLWWAGKELQRGKKLQDFIGKNEKTKLIVKIQKVKKNVY